jgi:hypothetical protein
MRYFELDLNGENLQFRLTSAHALDIERSKKVKLLDLMQDYAMESIITLLTYLRKSSVPTFNEKQALVLYDTLVDNGYTLERVLDEIIFEALVVSGFLSEQDLTEMRAEREQLKAKA